MSPIKGKMIQSVARHYRRVYVFQINTPTDRNLLPLAAGLITSYCKSSLELIDKYKFKIEILRKDPQETVDMLEEPDVLAFSCYSWNLEQSIAIAKLAKKKWSKCLTVMGGPSSPSNHHNVKEFIGKYKCIDVFVVGEGEITFSEILKARLKNHSLENVNGLFYLDRHKDEGYRKTPSRQPIADLNMLPSPFLDGTFDELVNRHKDQITGSLWETNRGCPFSCTFCYWGQVQNSRIRTFDMKRLFLELEWFSKNKIGYVYASDGNFGILPRDREIAQKFASSRQKTGYPWHFMINWTKRSTKIVFEIADILKKGDVGFSLTLSVQSFTKKTLEAVKRINSDIVDFEESIKEANKRKISTYSDLIMALPNDSYKTFSEGLRNVFQPYQDYHYSIYLCRLLAGSEMHTPAYMKKYNIETRTCLVEMGRREITTTGKDEYEELVVSNSTLPVKDWKKLYTFCYMATPLYNYRLAFFVLNYLKYEYAQDILEMLEYVIDQAKTGKYSALKDAMDIVINVQNSILNNVSSVTHTEFTRNLKWEPYEAALLKLLSQKNEFYREMWEIIITYLAKKKVIVNDEVLTEAFAYQKLSIPSWGERARALRFEYNLPEYFKSLCVDGKHIPIRKKRMDAMFNDKIPKDPIEFASIKLIGGHTFKHIKAEIINGKTSVVVEKASNLKSEFVAV
jgi:putative methyltransferase